MTARWHTVLWRSSRQSKLQVDRTSDGKHVFVCEISHLGLKTLFADRGDLIRHSFSRLPVEINCSLARIDPGDSFGNRNHLDTVQIPVRRIIADNYRRTRLLYFAAQRGIKVHPPNLTAQ